MAEIVGGFASSHTLLVSAPGNEWAANGARDHGRFLVRPSDGQRVPYDELLATADPAIAEEVNLETFDRKHAAITSAVDELQRRFVECDPDVVVAIGDDQEELLFDDNYPMISLYWGETLTHYPRMLNPALTEEERNSAGVQVYGTEIIDYPIETSLGRHLVEELCANDFDIAQSRYLKTEYGGTVGPGGWYLDAQRSTAPRRHGMAHAFSFPVHRWFGGKRPPMVPITINTCYPPNWISPRRAWALGEAVHAAIKSWDSDLRVAIVTTGGLSHFTVDKELDLLALEGLQKGDREILTTLPRHRLQSATTEILNWTTAAAAVGGTPMTLLEYQPAYRTEAGTGCGLAAGYWTTDQFG